MEASKLIILVPYCREHFTRFRLCEQTWIPEAHAAGFPVVPYSSGDYSYNQLAIKIRNMFQFASELYPDATHYLKVDTDTYVWPERLNTVPWQDHDYIGNHGNPPLSEPYKFNFCVGGPGYIISTLAASYVRRSSVDFVRGGIRYTETAEDRFVGRVMHDYGVPIYREERFNFNGPWNTHDYILWHGFGVPRGKARGCPYLAK